MIKLIYSLLVILAFQYPGNIILFTLSNFFNAYFFFLSLFFHFPTIWVSCLFLIKTCMVGRNLS